MTVSKNTGTYTNLYFQGVTGLIEGSTKLLRWMVFGQEVACCIN